MVASSRVRCSSREEKANLVREEAHEGSDSSTAPSNGSWEFVDPSSAPSDGDWTNSEQCGSYWTQ